MKEGTVDCERAVVAHNQAPEVSQPGVGAFHDPSPLVPPQGTAILRRRPNAILLMRADQFDAALPQTLPQRIAVVCFVSDHPHRLLPRTARMMTPSYLDRRERRFREPDFRRGCRVKVVSQRNTLAVDHHHPLRPLAPLGFSDSTAPFFAGAKLPSRNDSLHFNCWRSFNSLRNARQMFNQTPRSSQSRSRRQQVEGCGNFSGKSCQRAPLRRIHKIPSNTRRFSIHGRPPLRGLGGLGSNGAIFFHCDSASNGPDRAIRPPLALLTLHISHFQQFNHHHLNALYRVVQQLLGILPLWAADHGVGTSIYYEDPERNVVEINVNNFGSPWTATEYLRSGHAGVPAQIDLDKLVAGRKTSTSPWELHKRATAGDFAPAKPFDPRTRF
jgi:hypothetical protein